MYRAYNKLDTQHYNTVKIIYRLATMVLFRTRGGLWIPDVFKNGGLLNKERSSVQNSVTTLILLPVRYRVNHSMLIMKILIG